MNPSGNRLQNFMEERLIRWNPSDSQNNSEGALNGTHPYQINVFRKLPSEETAFKPFASLSSWFGPKTKVPDLERGPDPVEGSSSNQQKPGAFLVLLERENSTKFLSISKLKANSSNSIFPEMCQNVNPDDHRPANTPRAVPFEDLDLHFDKEQGRIPDEVVASDEDILGSLGITGADIITEIDDFMVSCLNGVWTTLDSMWNGCAE